MIIRKTITMMQHMGMGLMCAVLGAGVCWSTEIPFAIR
jgi:hypothetical protein